MISLLDCTLRDGGYVNDWNFGHDNIVNIFERLADSRVDMIEIGFLDERRPFDKNRSIMPDTRSANEIYGHLDKKNSIVVAMIDYGTCSIENIQDVEDTCIDAIRVIFKKHIFREALDFCAAIKKKGYLVFAQMVSVTSYSDDDMMEFIEYANGVKPYAVSMVDTYGLTHQDNIMHYFSLLDKYLDPQITIGYHGHNNFQMGYANCISVIKSAEKTKRNLLVDGSLYGMGKSAGNAPIELIAMYLNQLSPKRYSLYQMLEAIDSTIMNFFTSATWGYNLFFFIAASNDCHPNYVSFLLNKKTLSVKSVNDILQSLCKEKALLYDESYIEELYIDYQKNDINDDDAIAKLQEKLEGKEVLLIGPGKTLEDNYEKIKTYIKDNNPIVMSINCIPEDIKIDYMFLCNAKRYIQLASKLSKEQYNIIATSNLTKTGSNEFKYVLNYAALLENAPIVADSAMIMITKVLSNIKCKALSIAGLDGYTESTALEFSNETGAEAIVNISGYINEKISNCIYEHFNDNNVTFLTESLFDRARENEQ